MTFCEDAPCCGCCDPRERGWYDDPSEYYYDLDTEYGIDRYDAGEPDPIDPSECDHGDWNGKGNRTVECAWCEAQGLVVVENFIDYQWDEEIEKVIIWSA